MTAQRNEPARAVFLDRDGTIMRDVDYCGDPKLVELFPGAAASLRRLKDAGFKLYVITNQSGIGRGYFSEQEYRAVEAEVDRQVGAGLIDHTYFCPHVPNSACECRKPSPAMIHQAARENGVELSRSFMIGDKLIDAECGRNAGVRTVLVRTGVETHNGAAGADWIADNFNDAADIILRHGV